MNEERFKLFETALPEEFAEEAHRPLPKKRVLPAIGALAACLAVAAAVYFTVPQFSPDRTAATEEAPAAAEDTVMMRTMATSEAEPAEGAPDAGSGETYGQLAEKAILPPENATDVETSVACGRDEYSGYEETVFRLNGVRCSVRRQAVRTEEAALDGTPAEISSELQQSAEGTVDGVPAVLRWNEGQEGQILWQYEGELYCLTMDTGASEQALTDLAEQVFVTVTE